MRRLPACLVALLLLLPLSGVATAQNGGSSRGTSDAPYDVPRRELAGSWSCPHGLPHHRPVLLVHGTGSTGAESWGHSYELALPLAGYDACQVTMPGRTLGDAQVSAEYVAYAVHAVSHAAGGRQIAVVAHSQGNLDTRWALTFWPSTRALVSDYISLAGDHHGATGATAECAGGSCAPSVWQQESTSKFLGALNARPESPPGIAVTSIYSETDEIIGPEPDKATATSRLRGARNIDLQDICPGKPVQHVQELTDGVVFALVVDALAHPGPADPRRLPATVCAAVLAPGLSPADAAYVNGVAYGNAVVASSTTQKTTSEPPLRRYAAS